MTQQRRGNSPVSGNGAIPRFYAPHAYPTIPRLPSNLLPVLSRHCATNAFPLATRDYTAYGACDGVAVARRRRPQCGVRLYHGPALPCLSPAFAVTCDRRCATGESRSQTSAPSIFLQGLLRSSAGQRRHHDVRRGLRSPASARAAGGLKTLE